MTRDFLKKIVKFVFSFLIRPWFWAHRWMRDQVFLIRLRSRDFPPGILAYPIWLISGSVCNIRKCWDVAYMDYGLRRYSKWAAIHYSPKGRSYLNFDKLSDKELLSLYGGSGGRIEYFLKNNSQILSYENGQSFLDAGCGVGQNIKVLSEYFPDSPIRAFDVSEGAIEVVKLGTREQKKILAESGSITDPGYLGRYADDEFDHVFICHAFSFLMADGETATRELRQRILDELVRIGRKTVLILDSHVLNLSDPSFEIEQLNRATYSESIIPYFQAHLAYGEICALFSLESVGVLYRKHPIEKLK
jgi:SAM-dependent methyltransferase